LLFATVALALRQLDIASCGLSSTWGFEQVSVEAETYARSMEGGEGIDATWMVEDVDGQYGASPGVLNLEGNLAYVNATAYGTMHPFFSAFVISHQMLKRYDQRLIRTGWALESLQSLDPLTCMPPLKLDWRENRTYRDEAALRMDVLRGYVGADREGSPVQLVWDVDDRGQVRRRMPRNGRISILSSDKGDSVGGLELL
jgi:hypothetical protein